MRAAEFVSEKWSAKYKRSINCSNPRGFSQRAHCQGRKKNEDLTEFAIDKEPNGDNRSRLIGSIMQLLKAGKKVDFFVPGIRGHVVGSGGNGDWLTMKRWNKPHSKINYSLALDASDDDRFALKLIKPDYYQVVEKTALDEEQLDELSFLGSQCTKDCSGHRAGYEWSQRKGGTDAASWSPSFNKGAWLHNNGF